MLLQARHRVGALLLLIGALLAVAGEIINAFNNVPLSTTWTLAIVLIVLGIAVLVYGINMYVQLSEQVNISGSLSTGILFLVGIIAIVGTIAIDGVVLPLLFGIANKIASTINPLGSGVQDATNTVTTGINSATNSVMNIISPGSGQTNIPAANIPQVDGLALVNSMLVGMKLPPLEVIANWGHVFLTGGPLAIGGLLLGLSLLRVKALPQQGALLLTICAGLNLILQILIIALGANNALLILTNIAGILFFLALAWLGLTFLFPEKLDFTLHLPFSEQTKQSIKHATKHSAS